MVATEGIAGLIDHVDWAATPIGPRESWPQSLRTALSICLESRFPILIWWGPELVMLYNDAYAPLIGAKHPRALGQRGEDCFPEIWEIIGPMLGGVRDRGEATWSDDQLLLLERSGFPEECYFTFSYSPIRDETGAVGGVFTAVAETTKRVIGERRLRILRELAAATAEAKTPEEACTSAAATLEGSVSVPFSLLSLLDEERTAARLVATSGVADPGGRHVALGVDGRGGLPLAALTGGEEPLLLENAAAQLGIVLAPDVAAAKAMALPIALAGQEATGVFVAGLNERRPVDAEYVDFLGLVARQIATAIGDATAYEAERRRADALAELDRAKTLFFTNVSHELRTPLTLILSPLEDLLAGAGQGAGPELELIRRNALRLLRLVNALLDFSRAEAGRIEALFEPSDLSAVTRDLASAFHSAVDAAGLRLVVDCPPLPEPVYVDREAWEKIVLNLLSNALKFTFEGEIALSLRPADDGVELCVRDTGIGIPADELPHLFERFHRVRGARGRSHEGSGIGLALVQELVELHAGAVEVESAEGEGTAIRVRLRLGTRHLPADRVGGSDAPPARGLGAAPYVEEALRWLPAGAVVAEPAEAGLRDDLVRSAGAHERSAARVLVVDDNADMRGYLARLLRRYWHVETAADGEAALAAAREAPPDLVLSDVMMPGLDGFELLRALRSDPGTAQVPVVLVSARAGAESAVEGLEAGADDYLVKPFSARELVARVRANLELAGLRTALARVEAAAEERARAERVLASLPEAIATVDAAGTVELWNAAAERITGVAAAAAAGRPLGDTLPGWDGLAERLGARPGRPTTHPLEAGGRERWLSVVAVPHGEGTLLAFRDATEERELEQMRSDLVTTISHELRTPVSSIYGAAATLARTDVPLDEELRGRLTETLEAETERLARVVDELVTVAALDARAAERRLERCDVPVLVERVLARARERGPGTARLASRLPDPCPPLLADEEKLEQVLDALVENGVRYGGPSVEVEVVYEPGERRVRFGVRDTGIGIAPEHHARIGEKFFRVDPELRGGVAGLGLGLYISRQLVGLMDGRLWFESAPGAGSTFHVELPRG